MPKSAIIPVRVKPGASRTSVGGSHPGPHGLALIVAVQAPAVDGKATEAARRALAEALAVPAARIRLRTGAVARDKLFEIDEPPSDLDRRLARLRDGA
jgi:uncharacterized protein YggU (UPF0235/DUF167 family)